MSYGYKNCTESGGISGSIPWPRPAPALCTHQNNSTPCQRAEWCFCLNPLLFRLALLSQLNFLCNNCNMTSCFLFVSFTCFRTMITLLSKLPYNLHANTDSPLSILPLFVSPNTSQLCHFQLNSATHFTRNVPNTHGGIKSGHLNRLMLNLTKTCFSFSTPPPMPSKSQRTSIRPFSVFMYFLGYQSDMQLEFSYEILLEQELFCSSWQTVTPTIL